MVGGAALAACLVLPSAALAGPNTSRISLVLGNDFTTAYFFRGILQERNGLISQPYLEVGAKLYESEDGPISSFTLFGGTWASIHSEQTLADGNGPSSLYEQDWYAGIKFSTGPLETKAAYYALTYPNGAFSTTQELDLTFSLNDSEWMGKFALYPSAMFAFETDLTAFGPNRGTLLQLGIRPTMPLIEHETYPVSLAFPVNLGLGLDDYYETSSSDDDLFGFLQGGFVVSVPLGFVPEKYGAWSVGAGASIYTFGSNMEAANLDDDPWVVGTWSISMAL
jgi:hypothetical protein